MSQLICTVYTEFIIGKNILLGNFIQAFRSQCLETNIYIYVINKVYDHENAQNFTQKLPGQRNL